MLLNMANGDDAEGDIGWPKQTDHVFGDHLDRLTCPSCLLPSASARCGLVLATRNPAVIRP